MRHTNLTAIEAHKAAAAVSPSPYDRGGILLAQMRVWRQRRIAALEAEIERLIRSYGLDQTAVQQRVAALVKQQEEWQAHAKAAKAAAAAKVASASSAAAATEQAADAGSAGTGDSDPWQDVVHWVKEHGAVVSGALRVICYALVQLFDARCLLLSPCPPYLWSLPVSMIITPPLVNAQVLGCRGAVSTMTLAAVIALVAGQC
jgi:hypothetical protein